MIGIIGNDARYKYLYKMLSDDGNDVKMYDNKNTLDEFLEGISILIAPIPFSRDKKTLNVNFNIDIIEFMDKISLYNIKTLIGGLIPEHTKLDAKNKNIDIFDFLDDESVAIFNAIPTAEGAIQVAMQESDKTLFGSNTLVIGYGRCGCVLANMLKGIGSNVSATYRKPKDFGYINTYGLTDIKLSDIKNHINKYDFIFNTIPFNILNEDVLKNVDKDAVLIDLAEAPGGIDYNVSRELGLKAIYCPALPGRVAPYTAGQILKKCIDINFLNKS